MQTDILVVEDEAIVAEDIRSALERFGYAVSDVAASAEDALRVATARAPSLALLDIRIQGEVDGIAVAERLRELGVPVVFLTSYSDEPTLLRARAATPFGYLLKPFDERELRAAIEVAIFKHAMEVKQVERERWFSTTLQSIGDGVIAADASQRVAFMNSTAEALSGWPIADAVGKPLHEIFEIVDARTGQPKPRIGERALQERAKVALPDDVALRSRSGSTVEIDDSAAPIVDASGKALGVVVVFRDVERERRAERALRESEASFRATFDASPLPKCIYDAGSRAILAVNDAALHLYGYSREEFRAMTLDAIAPVAVDSPGAGAPDRATGQPAGVVLHRRRDGSTIEVEVWHSELTFAGRAACLLAVHDVTAQRRMEEQLRLAQKMEAIGKLAGGVAHDFNNLLTAILSYTGMLARDPQTSRRIREDLEEIEKAGRRAADLTRQLLDFSCERPVQAELLDLDQVVDGLSKMLRRVVGENIEFRTLLTTSSSAIRAERGRVEQVITNLVINARDAMPAGGKLAIETSEVTLDAAYVAEHVEAKPGPHVVLSISDTGTGMDRATLVRIFEPFFTTKERGRGSGIGLATVYAIVRRYGGHVRVDSDVGRGTSFRIFFPRQEAAPPRWAPVQASLAPKGTETILLVEDEDQVRVASRRVLEASGYRVIEARDAEEALLLWEGQRASISLLLTDVVLPGLSGPELLGRLRLSRPDMKAIVMSGYAGDALERLSGLGANSPFLRKPFSPGELARKVRDVLDGVTRADAPQPPKV